MQLLFSVCQAARLKARQLISKRDGLREDAAKDRSEAEEQQVCIKEKQLRGDSIFHNWTTLFSLFLRQQILTQTRESNEKLRAQIKIAQDERDQLLNKITESW